MTSEIVIEQETTSKEIDPNPVFLHETQGHAIIHEVVTSNKTSKIILRSMDIAFPENKLTAIMGPSGGGKSTLLDLLTGSIASGLIARGEVYLPGRNSYVPQDDRLHGFYTCQSYMRHYARLSGMKVDEITNRKIDEILKDLGLGAHKDTRVGDMFLSGLSGGQKRRLSVALEVLTDPNNLFLDEPTSGLDAESAYQVITFLQKYVREAPGRRVILTIHQPSSFIWQMIDNVVLLSKGFLVYQGSVKRTELFFESCGFPTPEEYNPADHYANVTNDDFGTEKQDPGWWASKFETWTQSQSSIVTLPQKEIFRREGALRNSLSLQKTSIETKRGGTLNQIIELVRRYFTNILLNPGMIGVRIVMYAMLALIIGIFFWKLGDMSTYTSIQSRIALAFYCAAFFIFMSVAVMPFILVERGIVEKEVRNGYYHPAAYQLAQALNSIPGCAILAFVTTSIIVSMTGFREPVLYFVVMFLALLNAEALNQLVSYGVPHFIIGIALVAGIFGLFMLLQGFMLVPSEFPGWLKWSYKVPFHTYAWRQFMYLEFHDNSFPDAIPALFQDGNAILRYYEIDDINTADDLVTLLGYAGILHLLSIAVVYISHRKSKQANVEQVKQNEGGGSATGSEQKLH